MLRPRKSWKPARSVCALHDWYSYATITLLVVVSKKLLEFTNMMINPEILIPRQGPDEMSSSPIKRLQKNLQKTGFDATQPIKVAEIDGKFIIIDGHHRTAAAIKAKIKHVPITRLKVTIEPSH